MRAKILFVGLVLVLRVAAQPATVLASDPINLRNFVLSNDLGAR